MNPFDDGDSYNPFANPSRVSKPDTNVLETATFTAPIPNVVIPEQDDFFIRPSSLNTANVAITPTELPSQNIFPPINVYPPPLQHEQVMPPTNQRQFELDARERDLAERERLQTIRENTLAPKNFPPFPKWMCLNPCFYISIKDEIPTEYRATMRVLALLLMVYCILLFINMIGAIAYGALGADGYISHAILGVFFAFSVSAYSFYMIFWATYKAFKTRTRFNYLISMIGLGIFIIILLAQIIGAKGSGWCGIIVMVSVLEGAKKSYFIAIICAICSLSSFIVVSYQGITLMRVWRCFISRDKTGEIPIEAGLSAAVRTI